MNDPTESERAEDTLSKLRDELALVQGDSALGKLTAASAYEAIHPLTAIRSNAQAAKRLINADSADLKEIEAILDDIIEDNRRATEILIGLRTLFKK